MTSLARNLLDIPDHDDSELRSYREPFARHLRVVRDFDEDYDAPDLPTLASDEPRPARVLIAEDDEEMRRLLCEEFREAGYQVFQAENGRRLLKCVNDRAGRPCPEPDLLISDIRMPGLSGLEVLRYLRKSDWTMPVLMITAFGDKQTHEQAKTLGAAAVMDKPFDIEDLVFAAQTIVPAEV